MATTWVILSTKAYFGQRQTIDWCRSVTVGLQDRAGKIPGIACGLIPSFPVIVQSREILQTVGAFVGAQDVAIHAGALTGEVPAPMLAEIGVSMIELNHAERTGELGETPAVVAAKTEQAVTNGMRPLLCVGEAERVNVADAAAAVVEQFEAAASAVGGSTMLETGSILAYEPHWAIGAAQAAEPAYVNDVIARVREQLQARYGKRTTIIYGGSAGPGTLTSLTRADGVFLGRFGHSPQAFLDVVDEAVTRSQVDS